MKPYIDLRVLYVYRITFNESPLEIMNTIKKLLAVGLSGLFIAFSLNAQTAPNASVDNEGRLVLEGGQVIPIPAGTVNQDGSLTIGSVNIPAPTATVNPDGSLTVGTDTFPVPSLPIGGEFIVDWFGDDLFDLAPEAGPEVDQWYWNFKFKMMLHQASGNWFYSLEFDAWMYISPDGSNPDNGFWAFFIDLFDGDPVDHAAVAPQAGGLWAYLWTGPQADFFNDLRDQDLDGVNEIPVGETGNYKMDGWLWVLDANGYDSQGEGLFWFSEYETKYGDTTTNPGNFITRFWSAGGNPDPYWMKLSGPID